MRQGLGCSAACARLLQLVPHALHAVLVWHSQPSAPGCLPGQADADSSHSQDEVLVDRSYEAMRGMSWLSMKLPRMFTWCGIVWKTKSTAFCRPCHGSAQGSQQGEQASRVMHGWWGRSPRNTCADAPYSAYCSCECSILLLTMAARRCVPFSQSMSSTSPMVRMRARRFMFCINFCCEWCGRSAASMRNPSMWYSSRIHSIQLCSVSATCGTVWFRSGRPCTRQFWTPHWSLSFGMLQVPASQPAGTGVWRQQQRQGVQ
ncbi:hypothetical protein COO60DRAFT_1542669, partial [Scenedesmus sp. NREL 46B-D3]